MSLSTRSVRRVAGPALAAVIMAGSAAAPAASVEEFDLVLPAGVACADFDLGLNFEEGHTQVREFEDEDGNVVRVMTTGTGAAITLTNITSGESVALRSNGAVAIDDFHQDGTATTRLMGHNLLVLFPQDTPPGPSTTLHVGRVVFTVDEAGAFHVQSTAGRAIDICAALSGP